MDILHRFSTFKTKNEQDMYIQGLLTLESIKHRRPCNDETKPLLW